MYALNDITGVIVLNGMIITGMTSILTNMNSKRSNFFHRFDIFEKEVVCICFFAVSLLSKFLIMYILK